MNPIPYSVNYGGIQNTFDMYKLSSNKLMNFSDINDPTSYDLTGINSLLGQISDNLSSASDINRRAGYGLLADTRNQNSSLSNKGNRINNQILNNTDSWSINKLQRKTNKVTNQMNPDGTYKGMTGMNSAMQAGAGLFGGIGAGLNKNMNASSLAAREQIRSGIGMMGPWGAAIAAVSSIVDLAGDAAGVGLHSLDKNAASRAGASGAATGNNIIGAIPLLGTLAGIFGGNTNRSFKDDMVDKYRSGYSGSAADIDAAMELGKKRSLFGKGKINNFIGSANQRNQLITGIGQEQDLRKSSTYGEELASQNYRRYLGQTGAGMVIGKKGMRILTLDEARKILEKFRVGENSIEQKIEKFAEGGKMNIIAEGAYHSRKNRLGELHENFEDVTKKGVPVVSLSEGGEISQHAEIEGGELILTKELTAKIEALWKDGSEESMIEAGRLLSEELLMNTDDKTNKILNDEDNNQ